MCALHSSPARRGRHFPSPIHTIATSNRPTVLAACVSSRLFLVALHENVLLVVALFVTRPKNIPRLTNYQDPNLSRRLDRSLASKPQRAGKFAYHPWLLADNRKSRFDLFRCRASHLLLQHPCQHLHAKVKLYDITQDHYVDWEAYHHCLFCNDFITVSETWITFNKNISSFNRIFIITQIVVNIALQVLFSSSSLGVQSWASTLVY